MVDKPRKAWKAGVLSFFTIGLGHVYSGNAKKGIYFYFGQFVILIIFLPLILMSFNPFIMMGSISIGLIYFVFVLFDAIKEAKKHSTAYSIKKYNKWYIYLAIFIFANLIIQPSGSTFIKSNIIEAYRIPSGAMMPTILVGDYILANKYIYKNSDPKRGDVVILTPPHDPSKVYVERLIGVGGDTIEIKDKQLFINGIAQTESHIIHSDKRTILSDISPRDNFGPVTVPDNHLFLLGDNRDNSMDSRFWGFASEDMVLGKVVSFYWSWDSSEKHVRWDRIGKNIQELMH